MGRREKEPGKFRLSRRDFLKVGAAAAAAAGTGFDMAVRAPEALGYPADSTISHTTCPYCSASCGQKVVVAADGTVLDVFGDDESPLNRGGLCAKGAGAYQLVTNSRRLGFGTGVHPVNPVFAATADTGTYPTGVAYKRTGNGAWGRMDLDTALGEIASGLVTARGPLAATSYNSKGVAFFGSSHMNNEQNYVYRKLIADFGTTNVEHQARI